MYEIKEENEKFVVYFKGKEIGRFSDKKEAEKFLEKETAYPDLDRYENDSFIID